MWNALLDTLPRSHTLEEGEWRRRHRLLLWLLAAHLPALAVFGIARGHPAPAVLDVLVVPLACVGLGYPVRRRRLAAVVVTGGLVWCSGAVVGFTAGTVEAHFHFFLVLAAIASYRDWVPLLTGFVLVLLGHGVGSAWPQSLIFGRSPERSPWVWALVDGAAVVLVLVGTTLSWRATERARRERDALNRELAEARTGRRQFTSGLLVNLARRNQSVLHRQMKIISELEEAERDPDALAGLFTLDHLANRARRNADSLLVLSGEQPSRTRMEPAVLRDVLRTAIAETEDLERVAFVIAGHPTVSGHCVTDLRHLLAELTENAVRFSPPDTTVTIRVRPDRRDPGGQLIIVEDRGVGMPAADLAEANALLGAPSEIDLSVSQRLGLHVVARLAARHGIGVALAPTPGDSGITVTVRLPPVLTVSPPAPGAAPRDRAGIVGDDRIDTGSPYPDPASTGPITVPDPPPAAPSWTFPPTAPAARSTGSVPPNAPIPIRTPMSTATLASRRPGSTSWPRGGPVPFGGDGSWEGWWERDTGSGRPPSEATEFDNARPDVPAPRRRSPATPDTAPAVGDTAAPTLYRGTREATRTDDENGDQM